MNIKFWSAINSSEFVKHPHVVACEQMGITESQWVNLTLEQKMDFSKEIALVNLSYGFEET